MWEASRNREFEKSGFSVCTLYMRQQSFTLIWNYDNDLGSSDLGTSKVLSSAAGDW